jgi:hypothetical protein
VACDTLFFFFLFSPFASLAARARRDLLPRDALRWIQRAEEPGVNAKMIEVSCDRRVEVSRFGLWLGQKSTQKNQEDRNVRRNDVGKMPDGRAWRRWRTDTVIGPGVLSLHSAGILSRWLSGSGRVESVAEGGGNDAVWLSAVDRARADVQTDHV